MNKIEPIIYNIKNDLWKVDIARKKSLFNNLNSNFSREILKKLSSPKNRNKYILKDDKLIAEDDKEIPINNGIPDFTVYTETNWIEKIKQAEYHDDEINNENFYEIVLRPYFYNKFFAKIWLKHLYEILQLIEKISNKSISNFNMLNCGCGGGFEAQFFAERGVDVVGFDISQLRVESAATRFALHDLTGFFYRGDASIIPFKDNEFDIVLYHDSLHHVPIEEIPKAIEEARRVSKKYIILAEAHDSPIRMILESLGFSTSIEKSGNYTFRFNKSLIRFWAKKYNMNLLVYKTNFDR